MMLLKKILLVDDDKPMQIITKMFLEKNKNFIVQVCDSGEDALAKAPVFLPDMILLDVVMPDMDGSSTLKLLREMPEFKNTLIVFITAKTYPEEIEEYRKMGVFDIINKPFEPSGLIEIINNIWTRYQDSLNK